MEHRQATTPNTTMVNEKAVAWYGPDVLKHHQFVLHDHWYHDDQGRVVPLFSEQDPGCQEAIALAGASIYECFKPLAVPLTFDLQTMKKRVLGSVKYCNGPRCKTENCESHTLFDLTHDTNCFLLACPPQTYDEECLVWANHQKPSSKFHHRAHQENLEERAERFKACGYDNE